MIFFSRVLHNEYHVLHPLLPERNDHGWGLYELRRRRHERAVGYSYVQRNFIYKRLHKYIGLATNISTSQLLYCLIVLSSFIIHGKRMCYVV